MTIIEQIITSITAFFGPGVHALSSVVSEGLLRTGSY